MWANGALFSYKKDEFREKKKMSKGDITGYHDISEISFIEARDTLRRYRERGTRFF